MAKIRDRQRKARGFGIDFSRLDKFKFGISTKRQQKNFTADGAFEHYLQRVGNVFARRLPQMFWRTKMCLSYISLSFSLFNLCISPEILLTT